MPQRFRQVPLVTNTSATGNNAAWLCQCGNLLHGRSGLLDGVTDRWRIDCGCGRSYFVEPEGRNFGTVRRVIQVTAPNVT